MLIYHITLAKYQQEGIKVCQTITNVWSILTIFLSLARGMNLISFQGSWNLWKSLWWQGQNLGKMTILLKFIKSPVWVAVRFRWLQSFPKNRRNWGIRLCYTAMGIMGSPIRYSLITRIGQLWRMDGLWPMPIFAEEIKKAADGMKMRSREKGQHHGKISKIVLPTSSKNNTPILTFSYWFPIQLEQ